MLCALLLAMGLLVSRAYADTYSVIDLTDNASDAGSIRAAVNWVNSRTGGDTIVFSGAGAAGTITLTNGVLIINQGVTIAGPGAGLLTISGNNNSDVFEISSGTVTISGLTIANGVNTSGSGNGGEGGGIVNFSVLTVNNCILSGNMASSGGGGIANQDILTVNNSTISGNTADDDGGGITNFATLTVNNSTISGNTASNFGGGIFNNSRLTVNNSTLYGNSANNTSGGIETDGGTTTISNSTISGNAVNGSAGGIGHYSGALTLNNSIVAGNAEPSGGDCAGCTGQSSNNLISTITNILNPDLGPLQSNGGSTETMMPLPGSPAIGAGVSSLLTTDQRGFPRPTGTGVASDLGALQMQTLMVTTAADSTNPGTICIDGDLCSLRDALTLANSYGSGDIVFSSSVTGTITLTSELPQISSNINLSGPGANALTISGANTYQVLVVNSGANLTVSGLTIAHGSSLGGSSGNGGGIENDGGTLTVSDCALTDNTAQSSGSSYGGGIANGNGALTVNNSTFSGNTASLFGGGLGSADALTMNNSTFFGNTAGAGGGLEVFGGTAAVNNSTLSGNTAQAGAGVGWYGGMLTLTNSIVAGNTDTSVPGDDCDNCGTSANNLISTTASILDPMLGPLGYNGPNQTVQTMLPLPGSPAIGRGLASTLATDQRNLARATGTGVASDLGSVETKYQSIQFVQQPGNTLVNAVLAPVTLSVIESGAAATNVSVPLTLTGNGVLAGSTTETTGGNPAVASYGTLHINTVGSGNTLSASLTITPAGAATPILLTTTSAPFDIYEQTPTLTFHPPASVVYGVAPIALSATLNVTGPTISYAVDAGPATISGNILTITGAGTVVLEAVSTASNGYAAAHTVANVIVTPAPLTITLGNATRAYGAADPAFPSSATGLVNGDRLGGDIVMNAITTATATSPVGTYPITAILSGVAAADYSPAIVPGTLTITAAPTTPSFKISASISSLSIASGQSGTLTLTLTPVGGYTGMIDFSCANLPVHATCKFSPATATFGSSPVTVTLTVATNVAAAIQQGKNPWTAQLHSLQPASPLGELPMLPAMIFWLPGGALGLDEKKKRKSKDRSRSGRMLWLVMLLALGAGALGLVGCGASPNLKTPTGQQTITIVAAGSGGVSQVVQMQVTVQ